MRKRTSVNALVVVAGDDREHDLLGASTVFRDLATEVGFATTRSIGLKRFVEPRPMTAEADVYVLYTVGGEFPPEQQCGLVSLVASGKGVVVFHQTNQDFDGGAREGRGRESQALKGTFAELVGSSSKPAPEVAGGGKLLVRTATNHVVTRGLGTFAVPDLLPEVSLCNKDIDVLATCEDYAGEELPVVHVREVGLGRVCYVALGHDRRCWGDGAFRTLAAQAMSWAAGTAVSAV